MATEFTEDAVAEEATAQVPNITAGDIATVVRLIDAGSERGAWKGPEMETIGALRTKFATVVQAIAPPAAAPAADAGEAAAEEAPAEEAVADEATA